MSLVPLISLNAPILSVGIDDMQDLLSFVYKHESILTQYGAIKIIPPLEFKDLLKKARMKLESPSTIQQVAQLNENDLTYTVTAVPYEAKKKPNQSLLVNETVFWRSLSQPNHQQVRSNVSTVSDKSFFLKRIHQTDFDIHQLSKQSLLGYCDNKCLREFTPSLIRAHEPGAIFPLTSARQRLFTFNYHHEGGVRHWYVIPASEREVLETVYQEQTESICFDHGHILINPLVFHQYRIRYYRLSQRPGEVVVLAAGALSQGFTEDASWNETVDFALPSWINDGHANAQTLYSCKLNKASLPEKINTNIFTPKLIKRYIKTHFTIITDEKPSYNIG